MEFNEIINDIENNISTIFDNFKKIFNIISLVNNIEIFDYIKISDNNKIQKISEISYIKKNNDTNEIILTPLNLKLIKKIEDSINNSDLDISFTNYGDHIKIKLNIFDNIKKEKIIKKLKKEFENFKINLKKIKESLNNKINYLLKIKKINIIKKNEYLKLFIKIHDKYIKLINYELNKNINKIKNF